MPLNQAVKLITVYPITYFPDSRPTMLDKYNCYQVGVDSCKGEIAGPSWWHAHLIFLTTQVWIEMYLQFKRQLGCSKYWQIYWISHFKLILEEKISKTFYSLSDHSDLQTISQIRLTAVATRIADHHLCVLVVWMSRSLPRPLHCMSKIKVTRVLTSEDKWTQHIRPFFCTTFPNNTQ